MNEGLNKLIEDSARLDRGTSSTASNEWRGITIEKMLEDLKNAEKLIYNPPSLSQATPNKLFGIPFIVSDLLTTELISNRKHKRRRNQTTSYHKRIQKKWNKRFGVKETDQAFLLNTSNLGLGQDRIVISLKMAAKLHGWR